MNFTETEIEIIMPPLIGDCIMTFPLINHLKLKYNLTLVCNEYVYEVVKFLQQPLVTKLLVVDNVKNKIIIDFLSNNESAEYIKLSMPKLLIGFKDGFLKYDLFLKQPAEFKSHQASSIFLYALELLGLDSNITTDFSCSFKWEYNLQSKILIAPSAGNIKRCYPIEDFILLSEKIKDKQITFLLGPSDKQIKSSIPAQYEIIESSNIQDTIKYLSSAIMVIASEGGLMHISASYGIPLIGLFKVASVSNWFPYVNKYQIAIGEGANNYIKMNEAKMNVNLIAKKVNEIYESIKN
jgi:ADP-heptose:LPS heptosyltransferase